VASAKPARGGDREKGFARARFVASSAAMIDKLELLLALAKARHFGKAAEAVGVSQPTLSSALKSLEEQLGVVLVERGSRFRGFTAEGERVLEWARRLVGDARAMREEVDAMRRGVAGHLRLGAVPTALPFVTELTVPFRAKYPATRLTVTSRTSVQILSEMENLELDLGLSYIDNEPVGRFQTLPLYVERYALLVSPKGELAERASVTWAEATKLPLCLLTPDMQNRRIIDRHLAEAGGAPPPTFESNSMLTLYTHVRSGEWVSIIPSRLAESLDRPGALKAIPLVKPDVTHAIGLIYPGREPLTPLIAAFVAVAKNAAKSKGKN
jgi:DNA-binding transcriptional LysR family regulator